MNSNSCAITPMERESSEVLVPNQNSILNELTKQCGYVSQIQNNKGPEKNITDEITQYRSLVDVKANKFKFKEFWMRYRLDLPLLWSLAKQVSCIPASSIASESSFSVANYINRKERSTLSFKQLKYLMLVRDVDKIQNITI